MGPTAAKEARSEGVPLSVAQPAAARPPLPCFCSFNLWRPGANECQPEKIGPGYGGFEDFPDAAQLILVCDNLNTQAGLL